jgi:hypothetical protein
MRARSVLGILFQARAVPVDEEKVVDQRKAGSTEEEGSPWAPDLQGSEGSQMCVAKAIAKSGGGKEQETYFVFVPHMRPAQVYLQYSHFISGSGTDERKRGVPVQGKSSATAPD